MLTRIIQLYVQPERMAAFLSASETAVRCSRAETGVLRFEMFQQADDPAHFLVIESYASEEARTAHLESGHFLQWKETVLPLLAQPLDSRPYQEVAA
ncbi:MAG: putative quinol monooxygenase [Chloroflexota bacterium]